MIQHAKEPRRVVAVNALRDIGDPAAIPALIGALGDARFTVRKAAARALVTFGTPAEKALIRAVPEGRGVAQREMVRALGELQAEPAEKALRRLLPDAAPALRRDVDEALRRLQRGGEPSAFAKPRA